jgi:CheY-like chemotaxis protein
MDKQKILIVTDKIVIQVLFTKMLETIRPFELYFVYNGQEALDMLPTLTLDLVIVHDMLPIMSDDVFIERVRGSIQFRDLPIIFCHTFSSDKYSHVTSNNVEKVAYPFSPNKFRDAIGRLLG